MAIEMKGADESASVEGKGETYEFPIVGIGASAGGLDPIRKLLEKLPIDTKMAFVVIQHLATGQESMLPEILSRATKMKVLQVVDGLKVQENHVYVIKPGKTLTLKNGELKLAPKGVALKPINDFFVSLASERKTQAIGIVLSGTGNDGTDGLKAIRAEGGITFVQDPETAQYSDMPKNAIASENPDFILSAEQIAKELARISKHPQLIHSKTKITKQETEETDFRKIIKMLKISFGVDFTHYRETTIDRRISRRMVVNKTENIETYLAYLQAHPNELQALFDDLLIGVTSFFREPDTFLALKEKVFPELVQKKTHNEFMRVWVPGCSTGEEVYSLAIAIQEFIEEKGLASIRIQIFGTDANEKNIEKARQGIYPKSIEEHVSENRLKRFFTAYNGYYRIAKFIRDMCIFAKQDITSDPPFSNLDIIMCRNVLIYFDTHLHEKILPIFHYGLKPGGFLVLSESESIGKFQYLFEPLTPRGLIYRRKQAQPQSMVFQEAVIPSIERSSAKPQKKADLLTVLGETVDKLITTEYGPATLLVNNKLDILVFRGDVAPYLSPESGAASFNVTKMLRKDLRSQVQTALYRAKKEKKVFKETVSLKQKGQPRTVAFEIRPLEIPGYDEPFYLVLFTEAPAHAHIYRENETAISPVDSKDLKDRQISELREDLEATKQSMQALVEGQEATNEELRSSMEEVQSSNEELQSTNEELETAKEELQSSNEELQTLNEELKNRNQALGRLNDDLTNLQTNIDIAVVIVDSSLRIRRFTVAAQTLLRISPSDVGNSIANVTPGVHIEDLDKTITEVIDKLIPVSQEVEGLGDSRYEMRVRPYLTEDKKIDGAFLSFTDITKRKRAEEALDKYTKNLEKLVEERTKQLRDTERLTAIGATAGMVGHDIRNPLQAISSDVYLAKTDLALVPEGKAKEGIQESLAGIEKNVEYINKIVQDLQDFVKPLKAIMQEMDLEDLCEEALFKNGIPENIESSCLVEEEAKKIIADPAMLKRILSNLVNNAVQAMPEGGKINIHAYQEANEVVITVQDTGTGIPEAIRPKLFTPLFTTKPKGQGFGLAVIKRMTEALGGTVTFESKAGKGTKFMIRFPPRAKR